MGILKLNLLIVCIYSVLESIQRLRYTTTISKDRHLDQPPRVSPFFFVRVWTEREQSELFNSFELIISLHNPQFIYPIAKKKNAAMAFDPEQQVPTSSAFVEVRLSPLIFYLVFWVKPIRDSPLTSFKNLLFGLIFFWVRLSENLLKLRAF